MQYRNYRDAVLKISLLGMGCMRLPTAGPEQKIDYEKAQEIIDYAYAHGVNYYDTAYVYHRGESEEFLGKALKKYPRESYLLADKMPGWELKTNDDLERIFNEQLRRCGADYFDFYLCHNYSKKWYDAYTDLKAFDFLCRMREEGRIRKIGFSSHSEPELLQKIAGMYPWDFAQIQLNYLDWEYQNAKRQYEILTELKLPVVVMEPVRGGRLASVCEEADAMLRAANPDKSVASWAIRFAASLPNVLTVLSGMTELSQVIDNVSTMEDFQPVTPYELTLLDKAAGLLRSQATVPCTACRYCVAECGRKLDIPELLSVYNNYALAKNQMSLAPLRELQADRGPDRCIACGKCAEHCPQGIKIPDMMKKLAEVWKNMARQ